MIRSFKGRFARAILIDRRLPKGFPADLGAVARRKLVQVNNAARLDDLAAGASLCLPLAAGESPVQQLEAALRHFWQAWRAALLTVGYPAWS